MKPKILYYVSIGILVSALGFGFVIFTWMTKNYDPLTFKEEPIPVYQQKVEIGQPVVVKFDYCKNVEGPEEVSATLVGTDIIYALPRAVANTDPGCRQVNAVIVIPNEASPGIYHIEYQALYKVNPIRTVLEEFQTVEFAVIPVPGTIIEIIPVRENDPIEIQLDGKN